MMLFVVVVLFVAIAMMVVLMMSSLMIVMMVAVSVMGRGAEQSLLRHVVGSVGEYTVLDVSAQEAFLGEWNSILESVVSPPVHPAEEKWPVSFTSHILVQVKLEKFFGSFLIHF